jgi:tRNA(Ile2) C34 agmatinyltransferase TiaS
MEEKLIIPITPEDFSALNNKIETDQDKFCPHCDGELISPGQGIFSPGIFYKCTKCGKNYKKTNYYDMTKGEGYFRLGEIKGVC